MKKNDIEINELLKDMFNVMAIAQTSCFEWEIDCKLDTIGRRIKRFIEDAIGDEVDTISDKTKKIYEKLREESRAGKNPDTEYRRLIESSPELNKLKKQEQELFKKKIDFEFQPVLITTTQRKEAYNNIPDDKKQTVEWKGSSIDLINLHSRFRALVADRWIVIEGTEEAKDVERSAAVVEDKTPRATRNRG